MAIILVCRGEILRRDTIDDAVFGRQRALYLERKRVRSGKASRRNSAIGGRLAACFGVSEVRANRYVTEPKTGTGENGRIAACQKFIFSTTGL